MSSLPCELTSTTLQNVTSRPSHPDLNVASFDTEDVKGHRFEHLHSLDELSAKDSPRAASRDSGEGERTGDICSTNPCSLGIYGTDQILRSKRSAVFANYDDFLKRLKEIPRSSTYIYCKRNMLFGLSYHYDQSLIDELQSDEFEGERVCQCAMTCCFEKELPDPCYLQPPTLQPDHESSKSDLQHESMFLKRQVTSQSTEAEGESSIESLLDDSDSVKEDNVCENQSVDTSIVGIGATGAALAIPCV